MKTTTTGIKLDPATRDRLKQVSKLKRHSTHWLMKDAIEQYLEAEERHERERAEDEARYQRFLDTGSHISAEEMNTWLEELAQSAGNSSCPSAPARTSCATGSGTT